MPGGEEMSPGEALRTARIAVDQHMTKKLDDEHMWHEETATDILLSTASPRIRYKAFGKDHEKEHGADWLWCWVDRDGTTFCLLVQAKILKRAPSGKRWTIDFAYKTRGDKEHRPQISKLIAASDRYEAAAAYVLYCGDPEYRATLECDRSHDGAPCRERQRVGVSAVSALVAENAVTYYGRDAGVAAFHTAVPVEDIAGSDNLDTPIVPLTRGLPEDLAHFLRQPQRGARRAAKELLRPVEQIRAGQFSTATLERAAPAAGALFPDLPADRGHFSVPYLSHMLRGLRAETPGYVRDVMEGRTPPAWVTAHLAGIVLVTDADAQPATGGWIADSASGPVENRTSSAMTPGTRGAA
ncbi:hypothetical protein [Streptomyces sp. NPDC017520]|uniref:hypothetical protein n=1 Tax=Streptomyces sp. NPDC017520 TaxID=3364998 RepID=UPI0037882A1A